MIARTMAIVTAIALFAPIVGWASDMSRGVRKAPFKEARSTTPLKSKNSQQNYVPKFQPLNFSAGYIPQGTGGGFVQSDGRSIKLNKGRGEGVRRNVDKSTLWAGVIRRLSLLPGLNVIFEGWFVTPARLKIPEPELVGGVTIKQEF